MQQLESGTQPDHHLATITFPGEAKRFYVDLKRNLRGTYVKISERTSNRDRSTIVIPSGGIIWFEALLEYYIKESTLQEGSAVKKNLEVEEKIFFFEKGENSRGKYLRISESGSGTKGRSSLIVPAGADLGIWCTLLNALTKMREDHSVEQGSLHSEEGEQRRFEGETQPSLDISSAFARSQFNVAGPQQLVGPGPSAPSIGRTRDGGQVLKAGHKRFFFDLGSNSKGDFLRITESVGNERIPIMVPGAALQEFSNAVQACVAQRRAGPPSLVQPDPGTE